MYVFCSNTASFPFTMFIGPTAVAGRVLQSKVCLSFHLYKCFLGIGSLLFSKFWHDARNPYEVVRDSHIFLEKFLLLQILGKKLCLLFNFYWICSIMKTYLLRSCTYSIFDKNLVPEICAKILSANQFAAFLNERYLQKKSMK